MKLVFLMITVFSLSSCAELSNMSSELPSSFTTENIMKIHQGTKMCILDVGGGEFSHLWKNHDVSLLDPFVNKAPYYKEKISYQDERKFDLIVFRGSINYLSPIEMKAIQKFFKKGTKIIFNTFESPPSTPLERSFESATGAVGKEISSYDNGLIFHQLIGDKETNHYFYYHTKDSFEKNLGLKLKIISQKGNSLILEGIYGI